MKRLNFQLLMLLLAGFMFSCGGSSEQAKAGDNDSSDTATEEWVMLLEGMSVEDWVQRGGKAVYTIEEGMLVGTTVANEPNSFLCPPKEYADFILEFEVKVDTAINSGVQIRSQSKPDYKDGRVHGYQVEIDPSDRAWSGGIYDEARRGWLNNLEENEAAREAFDRFDWNHYRIEAIGPNIKTWVNDVPAADLTDTVDASGFIGFQVHSIPNKKPWAEGAKVKWRNIRIQEK